MQFTQPLFLIGYAAILIPILIHLFNFRRYKTYYFSNVKMLQDVVQKTKRESQVKQLIVLCLRCLAIIALVTAFARPYFPNEGTGKKAANLVSIYIDNSFSMEGNTPEGTLFYDGIENAKQIIENFDFEDRFILYNNNFSAKQRQMLDKEEALQELETWQISPTCRTWSELLAFENNACMGSGKFNAYHYYLSDFQKNSFDFSQFSHSDTSASYLIHKPAKAVNNISIDSCWFLSPVFREGQQVTLTVRVHNCGDGDVMRLPMKLHVNGEQKALAAVDIAAHSTADCQLNYTLTSPGLQRAVLAIEDAPITFDNQLYFTYHVSSNANVSVIHQKDENRYLLALYGKDSIFNYTAMSADRIDYSRFNASSVVVLDEVEQISSGLADELTKYLNRGGCVLVLPAQKMDAASWGSFLASVDAAQYASLNEQQMQVGSINAESIYFKGSLDNNNERLDMPTATRYYGFSNFHSDEAVMTFENGSPLLFVNQVGKGRLILSAVAMNDDFGNIHKHALFFIPLHNMGIRSLMQQKLYNVIGRDHSQSIAKSVENSENVFSLKSENDGSEIIPEQKNLGSETMLFFDEQISQAGIYKVMHDGAEEDAIAFNFNRQESQLTYYSPEELQEIVSQQPKEAHVQMISSDGRDISNQVIQTIHGRPLWFYFVIAALVALALEVAILRLWRRRDKQQSQV